MDPLAGAAATTTSTSGGKGRRRRCSMQPFIGEDGERIREEKTPSRRRKGRC